VDLLEQVRRAQQGSDDAAAIVCRLCSGTIRTAVRRYLHAPLTRLYDSGDFVNRTLLKICRGHFPERVLRSVKGFWAYVRTIARHEVQAVQRIYKLQQKHQLGKDVPLGSVDLELLARADPPEEQARLNLLLGPDHEGLLDKLPACKREMAEQVIRGDTPAGIARACGVTEKQVYKVADWLKRQLRQ
jgi:hypothetical protein